MPIKEQTHKNRRTEKFPAKSNRSIVWIFYDNSPTNLNATWTQPNGYVNYLIMARVSLTCNMKVIDFPVFQPYAPIQKNS